jgi:hypothetical protein
MKRQYRNGLLVVSCAMIVAVGWRVASFGGADRKPVQKPTATVKEIARPPSPERKRAPTPPPRFLSQPDPAPGYVVVPKEAIPDGQPFPVYKTPEAYEIKVEDYPAVQDMKKK